MKLKTFLTQTRWLVTIIMLLSLGISNAWGADSGLTASPGVFVIDFYNSNKLTSTSGTTLSLANCTTHVKVPTGITAKDVVTAVSNSGTVQFDKNGGLTFGSGTAGKSQTTLTIGANFPIRKIVAVGTLYGSDNAPLYVAGTSITLNAKQSTYANCSSSTSINPNFITSLVIKQNDGSTNKKRSTLYTAVCEYGYRAYLTAPGTGSISAAPTTTNENGAGWNSTEKAVVGLKSTQKVTLTATPPSGYVVDSWTIKKKSDNSDITASVLSGTTLTMPAYDVTISVTWESAGPACDAPNAPNKGSENVSSVTLSTTSASANYDFYCSTSPTAPTGSTVPTASVTGGQSVNITGLAYGTTYYYWARKNCGASQSSWVAGSPATFTTTVPAPTSISAGSLSMNGATFTITDNNSPKINNYEIYYSTSNTAPETGTAASATTTTLTKAVTGLNAGTKYYYWVRGKGPNATSEWVSGGNFTTLSLSSISVQTAPTKTAYLAGEKFDPTGLVITRTYSNSTSDTYAYAGHTGEFTFSPTTSTTLTTDNTAVTITYGGKSVSQSIHVYSVTVEKYDETPSEISVAGVTASATGRTLSQNVGSTNYVFNNWTLTTASGMSLSGNSLTGTPTGNVVVRANFYKPVTVTWLKGGTTYGTGSPTTSVKRGTTWGNLTPPTDPGDASLGTCADKFMGWSNLDAELTGSGNSAPGTLLKKADFSGKTTVINNDITFRAVFAKGSTTPSTSYAAITSGLETNKYVIAYSYNGGTQIVLKNTADGTNASTMLEGYNLSLSSSKYSNPDAAYIWELQAQADGSYYIYNTTIEKYVNATTTALTLSSTPTKFTITYDSSNSRWTIQLKDNTSYYVHGYVSGSAYDFRCTTSGSGAKYRVYLYKNESQTTYSDYVTQCCANNVTLSGGSPANGTVVFSPAGPVATCSGAQNVTMTITPAAGYKLTAFSASGVSASGGSPVTSGDASKSAQNIALTFAQDASGTYTASATFTAMTDHYKDQLHNTTNYTGDGKAFNATYTVPTLASTTPDSGCEGEHYKFVGWVEDTYVKSDGTLNSGYTLITGGSAGTASEKTYVAIWAKEL